MRSLAIVTLALASWLTTNSTLIAQVSCQRYGNQTSCTNGQIFQHHGYQTLDNYGNSWQHYDHQTYGSDGSIYHHYGNQTYDNRGNYWQHYGNLTYGSNGTTCRRFGSMLHCN